MSGIYIARLSSGSRVYDASLYSSGGTAPTITTTSLPSGSTSAAYSQTLAATGDTPITWSVTVGSLPAGLSLNGSTGAITGTPTTGGTASFTVQASNAAGSDTQALSITVSNVAPTITTTTLADGTEGASISRTIVATGDTPMTWSVTAGSLPAGTSLNSSTGVITGTPTTAGAYSFTVQATNGAGSDTQALTLTIAAAVAAVVGIADRPAHVFLGINRIDEATLTGGDWPTLTLANLQDKRLSRVARSADATTGSTQFRIDLGQARTWRALALVNHNLSQDATWRVTLGTTDGGSDVYDSGWQGAWAMSFDSEMLEWEGANWWEGIADDDYLRHPWIVCHPLQSFYTARYATVEMADTANSDGFVQIGRVFAGGGFVPRYNASVTISEGWTDGTQITTGPGGVEFVDEVRRARFARFALPRLELEDFKRAFELQRRLGAGGEVLFLPNTYSLEDAQRRGFLGRLRELSALESVSNNVRSVSFHVGEIL